MREEVQYRALFPTLDTEEASANIEHKNNKAFHCYGPDWPWELCDKQATIMSENYQVAIK